ncbi:uncharacterized protein LOC132639674 [Lycium barbarum]|uniref:uncharacterized protein LOC132639674 n=1 Tax=Lycium barbarum TaxID=112863 RepID=UPI00293E640C|nr:uncharacterized protein LOC132639674 [Lycium barbarum]
MNDCGISDLGYFGSNFTWCNERKNNDVIWKRLVRVLANDDWTNLFYKTTVQHLPRISSDHCPILISACKEDNNFVKYFRFLNLWVDQAGFYDLVKLHWNSEITGNIFWVVHQKLKLVSKALSEWSRSQVGDIFLKLQLMEENASHCEETWMNSLDHNDRMALNKAKAELVLQHKIVDNFWRQKASIQ